MRIILFVDDRFSSFRVIWVKVFGYLTAVKSLESDKSCTKIVIFMTIFSLENGYLGRHTYRKIIYKYACFKQSAFAHVFQPFKIVLD